MAPQLQLNSGPQDALLYDNTRSYFTNVGYVRTSNFQMELRDIDPQNTASLGGTVNFVIPKAADLLGPCDLMVEFNKVSAGPTTTGHVWGWVENVGMAMIDKITFSVGSHDVETLTGDHLNIINELMRDDAHRYGYKQTLRTGRPLVRAQTNGTSYTQFIDADNEEHDRIIAYHDGTSSQIRNGKKLVIPLGLFFTKHPSAYFPIAAIAGVNDIRIQIKFKTKDELIMGQTPYTVASNVITTATPATGGLNGLAFANNSAFARCQLRCHYVHVTGPEATSLMNREHVRLMKLWHGNEVSKMFTLTTHKASPTDSDMVTWALDLSFLHPVTEIVITIRKLSEMGSDITTTALASAQKSQGARAKNYFAYQGGKVDPNVESIEHSIEQGSGTKNSKRQTRLEVKNFKLTLNGQSRHLDGAGVDRDYLMNRLMPLMHSNADDRFDHVYQTSMKMIPAGSGQSTSQMEPSVDFHALSQLNDRKEIYAYPFSLAPESANPSGAVNFSKVSHARLEIGVLGIAPDAGSNNTVSDDYQVDVYGVYYNWLAIKDGRAMTSFA